MKLKKTMTLAIMSISTSIFAQTSLLNENHLDSAESITFVEVEEIEPENKFEGIDELMNEKTPVVTLETLKKFCETNVQLFDKKIEILNVNEALKYKDNESIDDYCSRYVSIIKMEAENQGYMVNNLYSKPVEQGVEVDDLSIAQGFGQGEGVLGYVKNEDVKVLTVDANKINTIETMDLSPLDQPMNVKESLGDGEVLLEEPVVVNTNEKITDLSKKELSNFDVLQDVVKKNNLIGKILKTEPEQKGDIDMSQLIELLPPHMRSFHIRVIGEGMAVTLDFRDNRLNIALDKQNKIKNINIG